MQTPVQLPVAHKNEQVWSPVHVPVASHVCDTFKRAGSHRLVAGVHVPVHAPLAHTNGQGVPVFVQLPVASQTCGCNPLHCFEVGEHAAQAPATHATPQVLDVCQLPVVSQFCTWLVMPAVGLHRDAPGLQTPVQRPAPVHTLGQGEPLIQAPVASHV